MKVEQIITNRIVKLLETGTVPWHKPWANRQIGADAFPRNAVTKRHYRGINVFILGSQSYGSPYWLTYKEALALGGHVKAGEHGSPIVFWKWLSREIEKPDGSIDEKNFPMLRYYTVFNAEQTEGCRLPAEAKDSAIPEPTFNPIEACEAIYANMPNRPRLEHGATMAITRGYRFEAYYSAGSDTVVMPRREAFDSPEFYYSVLFHELTHSTGAIHRLNRPTLNQALKFGDTNYSKEEITAEMGASFLSGHTGIEQVTLTNNAAYLASWIKALKGDAKLVIVAAAAAQKAADYILNRQNDTAQETTCALAA
ncbi:MAG: ArdC-like ssDNA-binding domain-containing protein [Candidatus Binataceae bacterium]